MSENELAGEIPVPEQDVTAAPEPEVSSPEVVEAPQEQQIEEERKFTQADLDKYLDKRLMREKKRLEREYSAKFAEQQTKASLSAELPPVDQFESPEAYAEALAERKAQELIAKREAAKVQAEIDEAYHERLDEAKAKYPDFEQVAYNPSLPITDAMAETIRASEIGPELAYHLGSNPKEAERIAKLSPFLQAKEIGRIEAKLAAEPPVKKTTSAPDPIRPVTARVTSSGVTDTTDPRAAQNMSASEWIEADRRRQIAKYQAQRNNR